MAVWVRYLEVPSMLNEVAPRVLMLEWSHSRLGTMIDRATFRHVLMIEKDLTRNLFSGEVPYS